MIFKINLTLSVQVQNPSDLSRGDIAERLAATAADALNGNIQDAWNADPLPISA